MTNRVDTKRKEIKNKALRGEPVYSCGLVLYPITMADYEEYINCKSALSLRQSTFPVKYLKKDFLSAIFAMEMDAIESKKENSGMLFRIMNLLLLSLRIGDDKKEVMKKCLRYDPKTKELRSIVVPSDGEIIEITPLDFSTKIRPIIAELNGIELPKESQNLDLVESNEWLKSRNKNSSKLDVNVTDSIASVAYQSGIRIREIMDWTVLEYELRRKAIERDKKYSTYKTAELSGMVTFKDGNPFPSWEYDVFDDSLGTISLSELGSRLKGVKEKQ